MPANSISIVPRQGPALAPSPPTSLHLRARAPSISSGSGNDIAVRPPPQRKMALQKQAPAPSKSSPLSTGSSPMDAASPPMTLSISSSSTSLTIGTSKEWVLPPRPKPGRKPSVDTPVSKRKAQNRAAQRAFRERRANRVQELEQKLNELEKENELKELGFLNTITKLQGENKFLKRSLDQLRLEVEALSSNRKAAQATASPAALSRSVSNKATPAAGSPPQAGISPHARPQQVRPIAPSFPKQAVQASAASTPSVGVDFASGYAIQQVSPAPSSDSPLNVMNPVSNDDDKSCGICIKDDCLCEEVGLKEVDPKRVSIKLEEQLKTFKPMAAVSLRRKRTIDTVQELDFTSKFASKKPMPDLKKLRMSANFLSESTSTFSMNSANVGELTSQDSLTNLTALKKMDFDENSPVENCGFCSDDTPCVCREAAQEAAHLNKEMSSANTPVSTPMESMNSNALPPLQIRSNLHQFRKSSLPVMHPGPSVEIQSITNLTPGAVPIVVTPTQRSTTVVLGSEADGNGREEEETVSGCTGNPGTCKQCQADPMSTLFCTTVASKAKTEDPESEESNEESKPTSANETLVVSENTSATPTPPPSVTTPTTLGTPVSTPGLFPHISRHNSISMNISNSRTEPLPSVPLGNSISRPPSGIFIPCSDAYKTLSRHEKFNSMDFGTLVGKLTTRGMQVDASSVAKVLRELDKKVFN